MKVQAGFCTSLRVGTKFLKERVLERMTEPMADTFIPLSDKRSGVLKRGGIMNRVNGYGYKNGLLRGGFTPSQLSLQTDKPVIAKATETVLTLTTRNH